MKFGDDLRAISKSKKSNSEINNLKRELSKVANSGKDIVNISAIDKKYPTIFESGYIWKWLEENNISFSGGRMDAHSDASYTLHWQ